MSNISNSKSNSQVNGTADGDYIYNEAHHVLITAGKGDDTVELASGSSRSVYKYESGDGNDTIIGYDNFTEGVIQLTSDSVSNYEIDSKTGNHIIKIGEGSITLKDLKTDKVAIRSQGKNYRYISARAFNDSEYNGTNIYSTKAVSGTSRADYINVGGDKVTINAGAGDDYIDIDKVYASRYFVINGGIGNDTIKTIGSYGTLTGGVGDDVIYANGFSEVIRYNSGDGDDTVFGYTDNDTILIAASNYTTTASGQDVIINVGDGKLLIKGVGEAELNIKVNAPPPSTPTNPPPAVELKSVKLTNKNKKIYTADADIGTIDASRRKKATKITGNGYGNVIVGGRAADTLIGGAGSDTLTGGTGKDVFVHSSGDDIITDYKVSQDRIKLDGTSIISASVVGSDVRLKTDKGTLTVKNVKGKRLTITDSANKTTAQIFGTGGFSGSKGKEIIHGGDGNDTIKGGKGNDTLYGGKGKDAFFYTVGDGNDVVADFSVGDTIKLGSKKTKVNIKKSKVSGNDYILRIGKNTIKLIGAANQYIRVIDYAGNSQVYNVPKAYAELFNDGDSAASELDGIINLRTDIINNRCEVNSHVEGILDCINVGDGLIQQQGERHANGQINNVSGR